jgi:hypothetical protein
LNNCLEGAMRKTLAWAAACMALTLAAGSAAAADESFSLGIEGHGKTQPADIGLPLYPGSTPFTEGRDDKAAVTLGAWAGSFGLRLHVLKYQSPDAPGRIARFYAKSLARFGDVLDCGDAAARVKPPKAPEGGEDGLYCDGDRPAAGAYEYRVGTAKRFRLVQVKPAGEGTRFDMLSLSIGDRW